jgi:hypothetical protein
MGIEVGARVGFIDGIAVVGSNDGIAVVGDEVGSLDFAVGPKVGSTERNKNKNN